MLKVMSREEMLQEALKGGYLEVVRAMSRESVTKEYNVDLNQEVANEDRHFQGRLLFALCTPKPTREQRRRAALYLLQNPSLQVNRAQPDSDRNYEKTRSFPLAHALDQGLNDVALEIVRHPSFDWKAECVILQYHQSLKYVPSDKQTEYGANSLGIAIWYLNKMTFEVILQQAREEPNLLNTPLFIGPYSDSYRFHAFERFAASRHQDAMDMFHSLWSIEGIKHKDSCFHLAARYQNQTLMQFLLNEGCSVNARLGQEQKTPLHWMFEQVLAIIDGEEKFELECLNKIELMEGKENHSKKIHKEVIEWVLKDLNPDLRLQDASGKTAIGQLLKGSKHSEIRDLICFVVEAADDFKLFHRDDQIQLFRVLLQEHRVDLVMTALKVSPDLYAMMMQHRSLRIEVRQCLLNKDSLAIAELDFLKLLSSYGRISPHRDRTFEQMKHLFEKLSQMENPYFSHLLDLIQRDAAKEFLSHDQIAFFNDNFLQPLMERFDAHEPSVPEETECTPAAYGIQPEIVEVLNSNDDETDLRNILQTSGILLFNVPPLIVTGPVAIDADVPNQQANENARQENQRASTRLGLGQTIPLYS